MRIRRKKLTLFDKYRNHVEIEESRVKVSGRPLIKSRHPVLSLKHHHAHVLKRATKRKADTRATSQRKCQAKKKVCQESSDVEVIQEYMKATVDPYKRRNLTSDDFSTILSTDHWMNGNINNCAQNVLRSASQVSGLYDTSLGPHLSYPRADSFHQILHDTCRSHWIVVSTVGCAPGHIKYSGKVSQCVQKQTAAIMRTSAPEITFSFQNVQQQSNGNDCGVFSIAFLVELVLGGDPTNAPFDVSKLRLHLHES